MLTGLDGVPWGELNACTDGEAEAVPEQLRAVLAGGDSARRAIWAMRCALEHQGTVFTVTTAAVPFIGELAGCDRVDLRCRCALLELLFLLGRNGTYFTSSSQGAFSSGEGLSGPRAVEYETEVAVREAAIGLIPSAPAVSDELFVRQGVLAVVADDVGRDAMPDLVTEARRRLHRFDATAFSVIADLMIEREPPHGLIDELWRLDPTGIGRCADRSQVPYSLTDLLVERLLERFGGAALAP